MSGLNTLEDLLTDQIKDLHSAETQLVQALPKMAKAASSQELADGFLKHLEETKVHVERLERVAELVGFGPRGKSCKAMKGLIEEGEEAIKEDGEPAIKDLALIVAAQKVEHYEISGYGSARATAELLGLDDVVTLLDATLTEEGNTDKTLTTLAESIAGTVATDD